MRKVMLLLAAVSLAAGCATSSGASSGSNRSVLTLEEIQAHDYGNVYDLIQAERPWWLRARGAKSFTHETPIMVYVDGSEVGTTEALRTMSPYQYVRIQYYGAGQAQVRFGTGNVSGAIELTTQR